MVCLLVTVGILCICTPVKVQASERHLTGDTEVSTVINPAGTATTPEEVGQLNTANTVSITYNNGNGQINGALRILITLTLIALAPTIIIMMTSFTRIIIVLHFTRSALNTQTAPPNQILIGLALILTFFIMEPTITRINEEAIQPFEEANQLLILFYSSSFFGKNRSISDDTFSRISSTILAYSNFGFPETWGLRDSIPKIFATDDCVFTTHSRSNLLNSV